MTKKKPIILSWGDHYDEAMVEQGSVRFDMERNRKFYRPPACGTCGSKGWALVSRNGGPWKLYCYNEHEWVRTVDTVIIDFGEA